MAGCPKSYQVPSLQGLGELQQPVLQKSVRAVKGGGLKNTRSKGKPCSPFGTTPAATAAQGTGGPPELPTPYLTSPYPHYAPSNPISFPPCALHTLPCPRRTPPWASLRVAQGGGQHIHVPFGSFHPMGASRPHRSAIGRVLVVVPNTLLPPCPFFCPSPRCPCLHPPLRPLCCPCLGPCPSSWPPYHRPWPCSFCCLPPTPTRLPCTPCDTPCHCPRCTERIPVAHCRGVLSWWTWGGGRGKSRGPVSPSALGIFHGNGSGAENSPHSLYSFSGVPLVVHFYVPFQIQV